MPKRLGNIAEEFLSYKTWDEAERCARKGKMKERKDIILFHEENNTPEKRKAALMAISDSIKNRTYKSSEVIIIERMEGGKKRKIGDTNYYPDRIAHFAVYNTIKDRVSRAFVKEMYSYDKGIHELTYDLRYLFENWGKNKAIFILDNDIEKFYDSINLDVLLSQLDRFIKDKTLMWLIREILTSHGQVIIGMLLSTVFSSLYLTAIDRFIKEELRCKHYYRFADDFILISDDEDFLKEASWRIRNFLFYELKMNVRYSNVYEIDKRELRYRGFVHHRTHNLIKKETKKKFIKNRHKPQSVASYMGMLKWCDSQHLIYKTLVLDNGKRHSNCRKKAS